MPNVRQLRPKSAENHDMDTGDGELRRQAVLVTAMLPDNPEDALKVLELARKLVSEFWMRSEPGAARQHP